MMGSVGPVELVLWGLILIVFLIPLLPKIFYLLTLQKAFNKCAAGNRTMSPGLVWLLLIPLFDLIWHFFVVRNIADSLGREFQARGVAAEPNPGRELGYAMCALNAAIVIPFIGILAALAGFVCWVMYWVKVSQFSAKLDQRAPAA